MTGSQTYILKPLPRHAWITLNEKQSYLFTTTLIGLKVFIVPHHSKISFSTPNSEMKKLIDVKAVATNPNYISSWQIFDLLALPQFSNEKMNQGINPDKRVFGAKNKGFWNYQITKLSKHYKLSSSC